jgi:hypothetical protein
MDRIIAGVLVLLALAGTDCQAQTQCVAPARPELPSAGADSRELDQAGKEVNAYIARMREYRECLLKIVNDADNELATVVEGWNYAVERFRDTKGGGQGGGKQ